MTEDEISAITEKRLREEVKNGVQMIQYQVVTLMTTNGQAPFVTVFMYLNEAKNEQEKQDLALIIEETLRQRYQGVKNEKGVWITPAFPKLIYVLEEDNIHEDVYKRQGYTGAQPLCPPVFQAFHKPPKGATGPPSLWASQIFGRLPSSPSDKNFPAARQGKRLSLIHI